MLPSKLDNAKLGGQRLPITLRLRSRSWDVFADDLRPNHLRLAARFLGRSAPDARPKIVNRWFILILRKEVIQPHLPIRLPCYDFTPVTFPTLDGCAGFGCE